MEEENKTSEHHAAHEHHAGHESHKHEEKSAPEASKVKKSTIWMAISAVLLILLIVSIWTGGFKRGSAGGDDSFIFLGSEACTEACTEMEPVAKDMATKAGLSYTKAKYFQPVQVPGYLVMKDGVVTLNAVGDRATLAKALCDTTKSASVCAEADAAGTQADQAALKSAEEQCEQMPKVDKPKLEVFYVSRCPFGVQAINSLYYVKKNFGDKVDIIPRLLVDKAADGKSTTSMHGAQEHTEDLRHICLREEQPKVYWDYIHCYAESGDSKACEATAKVDSKKLADCEKVAEKYALKDADDWAKIYKPKGGSGSPSFFLNGEKINEYDFDQNGRSPDNLKSIVCCSAKGELKECDSKLQTAQPPRGFGKLDSAAADASTGQQLDCG